MAWREVFLEECEREACDDNAQGGLTPHVVWRLQAPSGWWTRVFASSMHAASWRMLRTDGLKSGYLESDEGVLFDRYLTPRGSLV